MPSGFHRIRHYGLLANPVRRAVNLAKVRELRHAAFDKITATPDNFLVKNAIAGLQGLSLSRIGAGSSLTRIDYRLAILGGEVDLM